MKNMTNKVKTIRVSNAVTVGTTTVNSSAVDTAGYEGVRFLVLFGTITDGTPNLQVQQGEQSNLSDAADLVGTDVAMADADDNKIGIVEVFRPRERYVRCNVVRGGVTGCVLDGIVAELFGASAQPVTKDTTVGNQEISASPAEGTP